jgi:ABC-type multidrug transport system fused ATPase/permease subunit
MRTVLQCLGWTWSIMDRQMRVRAVVLLTWMILGAICELAGVGLVVPVMAMMSEDRWQASYPLVDDALNEMGVTTRDQAILLALSALVAVYALKTGVVIWLNHLQGVFVYGAEQRFSCALFNSYLHRKWEFHLTHNSSELIRNVRAEPTILSFAMMAMLNLAADMIVMVALIGLLLAVEPLAAITVGMITILFGAAFQAILRRRLSSWGTARQRFEELRFRHLQQGLGAIREVLLLGRQDHFGEGYESATRQQLHASRRQALVQQMPRLGIELLAVTALAGMAAILVSKGRASNDLVPTLALFAAASMRVLPCASRIIGCISTIQYATPSVRVVVGELQEANKHAGEWSGSTTSGAFSTGAIETRNLTYSYANSTRPALSNVSVTIPEGAMVGFIGESGSGKSTLLDLLLGLLPATSGEIKVGSKNISSDIRAWQGNVGYVPQNISLIDDSLKRNIAFGLPDTLIDSTRVQRAIESAQLADLVASLPEGLETRIGERGIRLSGGQRQRIGIARALYEDPPILVLDEATSALDGSTESEFMDAVATLHGRKTIIIVAHRLSTLAHCDRIWQLEAGAVVGSGTYAQIVAQHLKPDRP